MYMRLFIIKKVEEAGSQTVVARKTGVSQGTSAKICNGDTTPELGTIHKIAKAYNLPLGYFLEDQSKSERGVKIEELPPDVAAIVSMLKDDPDLARKVRRFTTFEKQDTPLVETKTKAA